MHQIYHVAADAHVRSIMYERIPVDVSPKSRLIRRELRLTLPVPVPAIHETVGTIRIADNTALGIEQHRDQPPGLIRGYRPRDSELFGV